MCVCMRERLSLFRSLSLCLFVFVCVFCNAHFCMKNSDDSIHTGIYVVHTFNNVLKSILLSEAFILVHE